jgi:hypothetical protein
MALTLVALWRLGYDESDVFAVRRVLEVGDTTEAEKCFAGERFRRRCGSLRKRRCDQDEKQKRGER